jgi:hypothetical protein
MPEIHLSQVLEEERRAIQPEGEPRPLSALCISGGGIRSATFALGALQGLAENGLLSQFDYLSTVSGGGYIGSWLSAWSTRQGLDKVIPQLRTDAPRPQPGEPDPIQHLRDYNNYLSPRMGGFSEDTWTLVATVVRNIALNWLVLIPLLLFFLMAPRILFSIARLAEYYQEVHGSADPIAKSPVVTMAIPVLLTLLFCIGLFNIFRYLPGVGGRNNTSSEYSRYVLAPLIAATLLFCAYDMLYYWNDQYTEFTIWECMLATLAPALGTWIVYLATSGMGWKKVWDLAKHLTLAVILLAVSLGSAEWLITGKLGPETSWSTYVTIVPPLIGLAFYAALAMFAGLSSRELEDKDREWISRASANILLVCVGWLGLCALVLLAPKWVFTFKSWAPGMVSAVGGAAGWLSSRGRKSGSGKKEGPGMMGMAMKLAPPLFIVALAIGLSVGTNLLLHELGASKVPQCTHDAYKMLPPPVTVPWTDHDVFLEHCRWDVLTAVALGFFGLAWLMARFININKFSLHGMYRDRIIRAYLGASNRERYQDAQTMKDIENGPNRFTGFAQSDNVPMHKLTSKPFHVVNICLNLVAGERLAWQQRKAQSFTVSPLHCGNYQLGYREAAKYGDEISLGTAVTISGAAASPSMGYHSSTATGFIMTLLNARLGAWLGNPGKAGEKTWTHGGPRSAVASLLREAFGLTNNNSKYVYLSDGGHFENLALYEMVLRRCRSIVVLDSGCDEKFSYEDLGNALRKIRIDLNIPIVFEEDGIRPLREKKRRCAVARIEYSAVDGECEPGYLVYIKPMLLGDEPPDVLSYSKTDETFPHQSTADQWFDESQTESYRMLGKYTVHSMCEKWNPEWAIDELHQHILDEYLTIQEPAAERAAGAGRA